MRTEDAEVPATGPSPRHPAGPRLAGWRGALLAAVLWLALGGARAAEIWVVAGQGAGVNALSRAEAANLFLGLQGDHLIPFDQADEALRERFYRAVAGMAPQSVRAHWARQVFTGRGRPPPRLEAEETEQTLARVPAAVTYVPAGRLPPGARVLLSIELGEGP